MAGHRGDQRKRIHGCWGNRLRLGGRVVSGENQMIRFLKRHVWPWSEIEQGRRIASSRLEDWCSAEGRIIDLRAQIVDLQMRLDKYERPRGKDGRFVRDE